MRKNPLTQNNIIVGRKYTHIEFPGFVYKGVEINGKKELEISYPRQEGTFWEGQLVKWVKDEDDSFFCGFRLIREKKVKVSKTEFEVQMKSISIKFSTGNDSFYPSPEIESARILRELADRVEKGHSIPPSIFDMNGQKIGEILIKY